MSNSSRIEIVMDHPDLTVEILSKRAVESFALTKKSGIDVSIEVLYPEPYGKYLNRPNVHVFSAWVDVKFAGFITFEVKKSLNPFF